MKASAIPYSYGGKQRQIQVDLNTQALQAKGLAPSDVTTAIGNQNLILPSGTTKMGQFEYNVEINGSPDRVEELNNLPIKMVNGAHDLRSRCRACARWISAADEYRSFGWAARIADDGAEVGEHLDARRS